MTTIYNLLFSLTLFAVLQFAPNHLLLAQHGNASAEQQNAHAGHNHAADPQMHTTANAHAPAAHEGEKKGDLDIGGMIMHHITDAHEYHMTPAWVIPLPCIVYHKEKGFDFFWSSVFHHGHQAHNGYVMEHGVLNYVDNSNFPSTGDVAIEGVHEGQVSYNGQHYPISRSSFYDFSITKVVFTMLLTAIIMLLLFPAIASGYKRSMVPSGVRGFFEPIIQFIRDDIAIPNLGDKYPKYLPYLLTVFFFIWFNNLLGLIPVFPGGGNVMGNIAVTATLAIITFLITNFSGNKDYWGHIFNPQGMPFAIKLLMVVIEALSIFIKPFALALRLFANITAGHIIILSFVAIIFIVANLAGTVPGFGVGILSGLFMLALNALELFVAILQAYIFCTLSAVFIGQAIEEHHHVGEAHH
ncbi:MAG: F0F1 ATP synthase subunit A [Chitinophagales bacterium]|nr:F0F1 ATP synthase subunit A [Chitinophagales bacterium]